jgi:hypothetical protein
VRQLAHPSTVEIQSMVHVLHPCNSSIFQWRGAEGPVARLAVGNPQAKTDIAVSAIRHLCGRCWCRTAAGLAVQQRVRLRLYKTPGCRPRSTGPPSSQRAAIPYWSGFRTATGHAERQQMQSQALAACHAQNQCRCWLPSRSGDPAASFRPGVRRNGNERTGARDRAGDRP